MSTTGQDSFSRRKFFARSGAAALVAASYARPAHDGKAIAAAEFMAKESEIRDFLRPLLLTQNDVEDWLTRREFPFCKYDPELGYLHVDRDFAEGQDGAICRYRYDQHDAREMIAHAGESCRINTYGNSFTSCEQVSDGETWQEALAAHLGEPVRNFGIGGYSVYQAYLRMLREERRSPAKVIVFNIFDDDHARNLHGWQRLKFGVNRKSPNPTVPHLKVDLAAGTITECLNPCPTAKSLHELCDLEQVFAKFKDDFYLLNRLAIAAQKFRGDEFPATDYDDERLMRHGQFASMRIIDRVIEFAQRHDQRVLFVLSYGAYTIRQYIVQGKRFDQAILDYLRNQRQTVVDLMQAHADDAAQHKGTAEEALSRYFIGHYNPLGNHFCAFAMKDALVKLLDPKPPAYKS